MSRAMVVDAHCHMSGRGPPSAEEFALELRRRGVSRAIISTGGGFHNWDYGRENDHLSAASRRAPEVFIPFCTVNPHRGREAVSELRRAVEKLGMKGLKLHQPRQSFSVFHPHIDEIIDEASGLGVPVLFHDGTPPLSTPLQICDLAENHRDALIILGHSGLNDLWRDAISGAERLDNVILCTCATPFIAIRRMVERLGADRVVYGSDASDGNPSVVDFNLNKVRALEIGEGDRARILGLNILRILNLLD